eukprot:365702-Chlamydomonas_euryale.AAC.28
MRLLTRTVAAPRRRPHRFYLATPRNAPVSVECRRGELLSKELGRKDGAVDCGAGSGKSRPDASGEAIGLSNAENARRPCKSRKGGRQEREEVRTACLYLCPHWPSPSDLMSQTICFKRRNSDGKVALGFGRLAAALAFGRYELRHFPEHPLGLHGRDFSRQP